MGALSLVILTLIPLIEAASAKKPIILSQKELPHHSQQIDAGSNNQKLTKVTRVLQYYKKKKINIIYYADCTITSKTYSNTTSKDDDRSLQVN